MSRGDVIIVNIPAPSGYRGHEQIGNRPAVVVQPDVFQSALPTTMIIPFTANLKASRFPHTILVNPSSQNGLSAQSVLLVFQLRAIDQRRVGNVVGTLEDSYIVKLEGELRSLLGL